MIFDLSQGATYLTRRFFVARDRKIDWAARKLDFINGYLVGDWKNLSQYARARGYKNDGYFRRKTKGWNDEAADAKGKQYETVADQVTDKLVKEDVKRWTRVFGTLADVAEELTGHVDRLVKGDPENGIEPYNFKYSDRYNFERVDIQALKGVADAALSIHELFRKTHVEGEEIPLDAAQRQAIKQAREIAKDPLKVQSENRVTVDLSGLSDDELSRLAEAGKTGKAQSGSSNND